MRATEQFQPHSMNSDQHTSQNYENSSFEWVWKLVFSIQQTAWLNGALEQGLEGNIRT